MKSNWSIRHFTPYPDTTTDVVPFGEDGEKARAEYERLCKAARAATESVGYELQKDGVYVALWSRSVPVRKETSDG